MTQTIFDLIYIIHVYIFCIQLKKKTLKIYTAYDNQLSYFINLCLEVGYHGFVSWF